MPTSDSVIWEAAWHCVICMGLLLRLVALSLLSSHTASKRSRSATPESLEQVGHKGTGPLLEPVPPWPGAKAFSGKGFVPNKHVPMMVRLCPLFCSSLLLRPATCHHSVWLRLHDL